MLQPVKGTQDFLDLSLFDYIIYQIKHVMQLYHFTHIATPILEPLDLFIRSLGEQTDVVTKEMFIIDRQTTSERICLRPEATVGTMRAFLEHARDQSPWKVYSYGPMFRHERPQKGRYRQFHQFNIEIINASSISYDVQLITMLDRIFQQTFKLDSFALAINFLGCADDRVTFKTTLHTFLNTHIDVLCETCKIRKEKNILRVFDCKNEQCQSIYKKAPHITDYVCSACDAEWIALRNQLELLSVPFTHVPTLVRGLDYYDKTVFEFISTNLGAQNAFCSGGRYNRLASELGSREDFPAVGAALGIERLMLMLESMKDSLMLPQLPKLSIIIPLELEQFGIAQLVADELRSAQISTDILFDSSIKNRMRKANKLGAAYVIVIGPDEQAARQVTIKNMMTGEEQRVDQTAIVGLLK